LELHREVDWRLSSCCKRSYFASQDSGRSRGSPGKIKCQLNSRLFPPRVFILLPPLLTSLTAVSSSILRCKSSKMPCPNRASADMMGGCICCVVLVWCGLCLLKFKSKLKSQRKFDRWEFAYVDGGGVTTAITSSYDFETEDHHTAMTPVDIAGSSRF
jgi:hypothetical protein